MGKKVRGSITVESAFVMPLVLWLQVLFIFGMAAACSRCIASQTAVRVCVRESQAGSVQGGDPKMEEAAEKELAGIPWDAGYDVKAQSQEGLLAESVRMEIRVLAGLRTPWRNIRSTQAVSAEARRACPAETIRRLRRTAKSLRSLSELFSGEAGETGE